MIIDLTMFLDLIIMILQCQIGLQKLLRDQVGHAVRSNAFLNTKSLHQVLVVIIFHQKVLKDTNLQQDASLESTQN